MTAGGWDVLSAVAIGVGASLLMDVWNLFLKLAFGIPFFVMQPALGLGIAASRTPNPVQARIKSLATHTVF